MRQFYTCLVSFMLVWVISNFSSPYLFSQTILPDIVVAKDGSGNFTSVQEAILAVPDYRSVATIIFVKRGVYDTEKLFVPQSKQKIVLIGESRDETILSYHLYDCSTGGYANKCPEADARKWSAENLQTSATLTVLANDFTAENLTIRNTAGPVGQALALTLRGDRASFRHCAFSSYQDTLYFWSDAKRAYFENCLIIGRTDYIYGSGTAFFQSCEIKSWGGGWITAPSTGLNQPFGFVFHSCRLTYATNSPRPGDDGALVALGRPWHNYPKVAWLYCEMTEKINPLGWPDKWNMPYADTSADLHLYEYKNTGLGADMRKRSNWIGLRALTPEEAADYTASNVLMGTDGWNPMASAPVTTSYTWVGKDTLNGWNVPENWLPAGIPEAGQSAFVQGQTVLANGGTFAADLVLSDGATLRVVQPSILTYLRSQHARLQGIGGSSLEGRIHTLDTLEINSPDSFMLRASLSGVHTIRKEGVGVVILEKSSPDFSGRWQIRKGVLKPAGTLSLGKARSIQIDSGATLVLDKADVLYAETPIFSEPGSQLYLQESIVLKEWYIGTQLQPEGIYNAQTHPTLISGSGFIQIGRPSLFTFIGGANGNWDDASHFKPALLPRAGEEVQSSVEMETTSFNFPANIHLLNGGKIRLRGTHTCSGLISMESGSSLGYATSGAGFSLNASIFVAGDVALNMNSKAPVQHEMKLTSTISGNGTVTINNLRTDIANQAIVVLSGDNTGFTGVWNLSKPASHTESSMAIRATGFHSLGNGIINVSNKNQVILSHPYCAGDKFQCHLYDHANIKLDTQVFVKEAIINDSSLPAGIYNAVNTPNLFVGNGVLIIDNTTDVREQRNQSDVYFSENTVFLPEVVSEVRLFNTAGKLLKVAQKTARFYIENVPAGIYLCQYVINGRTKTIKITVAGN